MPTWDVYVGALRSKIPALRGSEYADQLIDAMSVPKKNARFIPQVKMGLWDGKVKFLSPTGILYTGLLEKFAKLAKVYGIRLNYIDDARWGRIEPAWAETTKHVTERDYQEPIVEEGIRLKRGIIQAAVNAGKTVMAIEMIRRLRYRTCYVVPSKELYKQFIGDLKSQAPELIKITGQIKAGLFKPGLITIAMMQSLIKGLEENIDCERWFQSNVNMVFVDEVHHAASDRWSEVFKQAKSAPYRIGLSATPLGMGEERDLRLVGLTGPVFGKVTTQELVARGLSTKTIVRFISYETNPGRLQHLSARDWHLLYEEGIELNHIRGQALIKAALPHLEAEQRVCVFVDKTDHGDYLYSLGRGAIKRDRFKPVSLFGLESDKSRAEILSNFKRGLTPFLITTLLKEGVNIPEIDILFNAAGMKSPVKITQQAGRVVRTREGKTLAIIYDFIDPCHENLLDQSSDRHGAYKAEGYEIALIKV